MFFAEKLRICMIICFLHNYHRKPITAFAFSDLSPSPQNDVKHVNEGEVPQNLHNAYLCVFG